MNQRFEYSECICNEDDLCGELEAYGKDGWQLVKTVYRNPEDFHYAYQMIFERPYEEPVSQTCGPPPPPPVGKYCNELMVPKPPPTSEYYYVPVSILKTIKRFFKRGH